MPERVPQTIEIALDIHPAEEKDLHLLHRYGWRLVDPRITVPDPDALRRYVQGSGAEFSVAQEVYTQTRSGWFSDRTVRYLASGKPALVRIPGFAAITRSARDCWHSARWRRPSPVTGGSRATTRSITVRPAL
jgi:hypothetical protein